MCPRLKDEWGKAVLITHLAISALSMVRFEFDSRLYDALCNFMDTVRGRTTLELLRRGPCPGPYRIILMIEENKFSLESD